MDSRGCGITRGTYKTARVRVSFDAVVHELLALVPFAFVGTVSPGPNNAVLWASGIRFGFARTLPYVLGTALAMGALVVGVSLGLGVLIDAVPGAETVLRVIGSLYLLFLAVVVLRGGGFGAAAVEAPPTFWQGFAFQWVNPKAWVFVLAVVGTFVPSGVHRAVGVALVVVAIATIAAVSSAVWAVAGASLARLAADDRRQRLVGVVLATLIVASVVLLWV
jgi:threonine/homoserine/homoserine lactone efflux protein